jgi:hypothetical protein
MEDSRRRDDVEAGWGSDGDGGYGCLKNGGAGRL